MKFKRLTAALASGLLLWGSAYAEQQPENTAPDAATGATGPGIVILELQGGGPGAQASPEEMLAMQLLLLQLLMMQADPGAAVEAPLVAPGMSGRGTGI